MKIGRLVAFILIGLLGIVVAPSHVVVADNCPVINYSSFGFEKTPAANWKNGEAVRVITWSSNETFIYPDPVSTQFSSTEQAWLQEAFDSYGEILDSVAFQKISTPGTANIVIGYTLLSKGIIPTETTGGTFGLWMFNSGLQTGAIQLLDAKLRPKNLTLFDTHDSFIHAVQNELGNLLGVPDVDRKVAQKALVTIYDTGKFNAYGQVKINDYDAATMRQLYGESTCSSLYTVEARAANLAADKVAGEKSLTARVTTTTVAASTPAAKTSITCVKGKTVKKVTALRPVCPAGYKKK